MGENATQMRERMVYVQPVPTALMMRSITETHAAPSEQRTRLFYKRKAVGSTWRPMKTRRTYTSGNGGAVVGRQVHEQRLRAVHDGDARPANYRNVSVRVQ